MSFHLGFFHVHIMALRHLEERSCDASKERISEKEARMRCCYLPGFHDPRRKPCWSLQEEEDAWGSPGATVSVCADVCPSSSERKAEKRFEKDRSKEEQEKSECQEQSEPRRRI